MMTSALLLIAAILLLGGLLAALGDYLGTKVGKARLRIFNLRPRQTATFVTIFTGTLIAASTLGILFATSASLRKGIFRLDEYLNRLQDTRDELDQARQEKQKVQQQLKQAEQEQARVQRNLDQVNQKYQLAQNKLDKISEKVTELNKQLSSLKKERQKLVKQRKELEEQIRQKDQELGKQQNQLDKTEQKLKTKQAKLEELEKQKTELQAEIKQQDEKIAELDTIINKRDDVLKSQEEKLTRLEKQISQLQSEKRKLEKNYQALRQGDVALVRGEVLSFNVVRLPENQLTEPVINQILREANQNAIKATKPGQEDLKKQIINITKNQVKRMSQVIQDGEEYVIQIMSAGNYLRGEEPIRVFADVLPNKKVFDKGETIASLSLNPEEVANGKLSKRIDLLLAASEFRARRSGMVGKIVVSNEKLELMEFMDQVADLKQFYNEIHATAAKDSYTSGPLQLTLKLKKDNQVILSH